MKHRKNSIGGDDYPIKKNLGLVTWKTSTLEIPIKTNWILFQKMSIFPNFERSGNLNINV